MVASAEAISVRWSAATVSRVMSRPSRHGNKRTAVHHKRRYDAPMPAKHPRLTITMDPDVHARLRRLSELTDQSQSALIGDMLRNAVPVFDRMVTVLEAAEQAKAELRTKMADDMGAAQARIEKQMGLVLDEFEGFTGGLLDDIEHVRRRAAKAGARDAVRRARSAAAAPSARSTPISNRGVRYSTPSTKVHKTPGGAQ